MYRGIWRLKEIKSESGGGKCDLKDPRDGSRLGILPPSAVKMSELACNKEALAFDQVKRHLTK